MSSFVRRSIYQHRILTLYAQPQSIHSPFPLAQTPTRQPHPSPLKTVHGRRPNLRTRPPTRTLAQPCRNLAPQGGEPRHQAMPRATEAFETSRPSLDKRCPRDSGTPTPATKGGLCCNPPSSTPSRTCLHASLRRWFFHIPAPYAGKSPQARVM